MTRLRDVAQDIVDGILDVVLRSGWARALSYHSGLQGGLKMRHLTLRVGRAPGAPPLRVGFASDFHGGPATHPRQLAAACAMLARARPDVLLLGGDFVSLNVGYVDAVTAALGAIQAPLGRFAVLGNHDYRRRRAPIVTRSLELNGIEVLHNHNVRLAPPHDDVWICGLDDIQLGVPDADAALEGADGTRLVLMHGPDGLLALGDRRFDVAFCGHTHGGQIALPWGTPVILPRGTLGRRYSSGYFRLRPEGDGGHLLVSRGVGCSGVPVRLFAWAEVHEVTIEGLVRGAQAPASAG